MRALGVERFGILALSWVVLGYFSMFDLGVGRASIRFAADAIARSDTDRFRRVIWTSLWSHAATGLLGGVALGVLAPTLVRALGIPADLAEEATATLVLLAAAVPLALVASAARGGLEAAQRFDLVNLAALPAATLTYALSAAGAWAGLGLPGIVLLLLANQAGSAALHLVLAVRTLPALRSPRLLDAAALRSLLRFGGWLTVSGLAGPVIVYGDRFLIAAILGVGAVAYYAAPQDAVSRLWIIPWAIATALFPAFSSVPPERRDELAPTHARASNYLLLGLAPIVLTILLLADEILALWLGPNFARESALVLRVLSIGVVANSLGMISLSLLHGIGRPDIPAKLHALELVPSLALAAIFIANFGIAGAALSWTLRAVADAALLFGGAARVVPELRAAASARGLTRTTLAVVAFASAELMLIAVGPDRALLFGAGAALLVAYMIVAWLYLTDTAGRAALTMSIRRVADVAARR